VAREKRPIPLSLLVGARTASLPAWSACRDELERLRQAEEKSPSIGWTVRSRLPGGYDLDPFRRPVPHWEVDLQSNAIPPLCNFLLNRSDKAFVKSNGLRKHFDAGQLWLIVDGTYNIPQSY
jgi:hypothetical protein